MYLISCLSEQGRHIRSLQTLRKAAAPEEARRVIADALPPTVARSLGHVEYESLRQKLVQLPTPPARPRLGKDEWLAALAVFLWVFLITFPVVVPFIFMDDLGRATRVSNAIAIALLFLTGYAFGRIAEYHPWLSGLAMVLLGSVLVGITMALGG